MDGRQVRRVGQGISSDRRLRRALAIGLAAVAVATAIMILVFAFVDGASHVQRRVRDELQAEGRARSQLVADWRQERLGDARAVSDSRLLRDAVARLLREEPTGDHTLADTRVEIANDLELLRSEDAYVGALLVGADGRLLATSSTSDGELSAASRSAIQAVIEQGTAVFSAPFTAARDRDIHLDLATPITDTAGDVMAVVLLRLDPYRTFYPDILDTLNPIAGATHPSLFEPTAAGIVEISPEDLKQNVPDGQTARGTAGAPPEPLPLNSPLGVQIIAAAAAEPERPTQDPPDLEWTGPGEDGAMVVANLRRVADSDWVLVATRDARSVDDQALDAGVEELLRVGSIVTLVALVLGGLFIGRQRRLLKRLTAAEHERELAASRVDDAMAYARDIVLLLDEDGAVLDANLAAVRAYGYDLATLRTFHLTDLRAPNERASVPADLAAAKAPGGIARQTVHIRGDGTTFPVEVSMHSLRGADTVRFEAVVRDIHERLAAERAMQQQMDELRRWQAGAIGREERILELKSEVNDLLETTGRPARYVSVDQAARVGDGR